MGREARKGHTALAERGTRANGPVSGAILDAAFDRKAAHGSLRLCGRWAFGSCSARRWVPRVHVTPRLIVVSWLGVVLYRVRTDEEG